MVGFQCVTDIREHASLILARTGLLLLETLETIHVGGRSAHIADDTIEFGVRRETFDLPDDGLLAPGDDRTALHHSDGTEVALTIASTVGGDGVPDRVHRLDVTLCRIVRVNGVLELHPVYPVQELGVRQRGRRVLDQIPLPMRLCETFRGERFAVVVECLICPHEGLLIDLAFLEGCGLDVSLGDVVGDVTDPPYGMPIPSVTHHLRQHEVGTLRHTVRDRVRLGIEEDRPPHGIRP